MGAAAALQSFERRLDLGFGRLLLVAQERRGCHDPAVDAVAALRHLLLDIGGLQRMRLVGRAEAGERDDFSSADLRKRRPARARRLAVEMHDAGAALAEPAAEMRIVEIKIAAQSIEQRHVRLGLDRVDLAVDVEREFSVHGAASSLSVAAVSVGLDRMCRCVPMPLHAPMRRLFPNRRVGNTPAAGNSC